MEEKVMNEEVVDTEIIETPEDDIYEVETEYEEDTGLLVKGALVGLGIAGAAYAAFKFVPKAVKKAKAKGKEFKEKVEAEADRRKKEKPIEVSATVVEDDESEK